jgi:hypothetical protein
MSIFNLQRLLYQSQVWDSSLNSDVFFPICYSNLIIVCFYYFSLFVGGDENGYIGTYCWNNIGCNFG